MAADGERVVYLTRVYDRLLIGGLLVVLGSAVLLGVMSDIRDPLLVGWFNLALGAAILGYTGYTASRRTPRLVIDGEGVWCSDWGLKPVPWDGIEAFYVGRELYVVSFEPARAGEERVFAHGVERCELRDPAAFLGDLPETAQKALERNRLVKLPRLLLPSGALNTNAHKLLARLIRRLDASR